MTAPIYTCATVVLQSQGSAVCSPVILRQTVVDTLRAAGAVGTFFFSMYFLDSAVHQLLNGYVYVTLDGNNCMLVLNILVATEFNLCL